MNFGRCSRGTCRGGQRGKGSGGELELMSWERPCRVADSDRGFQTLAHAKHTRMRVQTAGVVLCSGFPFFFLKWNCGQLTDTHRNNCPPPPSPRFFLLSLAHLGRTATFHFFLPVSLHTFHVDVQILVLISVALRISRLLLGWMFFPRELPLTLLVLCLCCSVSHASRLTSECYDLFSFFVPCS